MTVRSAPSGSPTPPTFTTFTTFAPGSRVLVRDEEWIVRSTRTTSTGGVAVHVTGISELVRNRSAVFLTELDTVEELRPEKTRLVQDPSPQYRRTRLYLESLLRRTPPTDANLYIGHRGAMNPAPYQLVPAAKALAQPRPRILIADGVGLGKTLEVGVLLSELIQRGQGERILVVALKSILEQFQQELWARFTIPLVRLDSVGLERVRARIPSNMNPFYYFNRVIISVDTLKKDEKYRRFLEQCHWDVVVVDECQNVAARAHGTAAKRSQRARLANLLSRTCDALVLTSATPHDGSPESFASLMNLLEPTAIADPTNYTKEDVKGLFIRRFKKDIAHQVSQSFRERRLTLERVNASREENTVFEHLAEITFKTIDTKRAGTGVLFRTTLLKAFLSSPDACASTIDERLKHKALANDADPEASHDRVALSSLKERVLSVTTEKFSKFSRLLATLGTAGFSPGTPGERVVIFSERIDTLVFLQAQLTKALKLKGSQVAVFHGSLDDQEQHKLVKDFGTQGTDVRILLASDAASEGINLHFFCHRMIHFDIPWSLITLEQRNGRIDRFGQEHTPEISYLLTLPAEKTLKGDLRILERLIEKEDAAYKNLGDAAWLLNLHESEKEEERIGVAISTHESAESVLPDETPVIDFLALLADNTPKDDTPVTVESLSLYADDLAYARTAFDELCANDKSVTAPEFHDNIPGFTLVASEDLRRRFDYLPRELRSQAWEFKLTTDRARVQTSLSQAREGEGKWPEWQLFWNLHPIAEWLNDRVLGLFTRHEAPVVQVTKGLTKGQTAFVFQGIMSNRRSQPIVVDWFGVVTHGKKVTVQSLDTLSESTGLHDRISNTGTPVNTDALEKLIPTVVESARAHMMKLRQERAVGLRPAVQAEQRRMNRWHEAAIGQIESEQQRVTESGRKLRSDEQQRADERRKSVEDLMKARRDWIEMGLTTVDTPYLRLAAVLVLQEKS